MKVWLLAFLCVLCATPAFAQSDRGTIAGSVTDPDGAVIPGVPVVAENPETGVRFETVTTTTGNYTISQLPPGTYNLHAELSGFGPFRQDGIRVYVGQTARIDVKLRLGALAEEVSVVGTASLLQTTSAEQSTSIAVEDINALPLNFGARGNFFAANIRNPYSFVTLVPGGNISSYSSLKVGGAPINTYQIRVDGMEANNQRLVIRIDQVQPSVESLEEMTVHTSNFAAEYGQVAGGVFNLTAKSGTNTFHGSAFEYYVNEKFGAGIPFTGDSSGRLVRPPNRRSNFGGSLGGPVMVPRYDGHNKTFFFLSFEQFRQIETKAGLLGTMPTDKMRRGDFSEALTGRVLATDPLGRPIMENAIYDPRTTRVVNGQIVRDPFPNNQIPQELLDPVALKIQSFIPTATRPGLINNWDRSFPADTIKSILTLKVDHNFGGIGKLSGYYSQYGGPHYNGSDGLPIPVTKVRKFATQTDTARVSYDWTMTPTTLLNARVGFIRHWNPDFGLPEVRNFDPVAGLGLRGAAYGIGFPVIPSQTNAGTLFSTTGGGMGDGLANAGSLPATKKPQALMNITHARDRHTYKTGVEWRNDVFSNMSMGSAHGTWNFNAQQTTLPSTNGQNLGGGSVGLPYASFLLGLANTASVSNYTEPNYYRHALSGFAQDTWRILSSLTIDYGVRWDYQQYPYEFKQRRSMFSPDVANPSAGGLKGGMIYEGTGPGACECEFVETYPYAFGPRVGASYQLNPKTVIRGGWGITFAQTNGGESNGGGTLGAGGWNTLNYQSTAFAEPGAVLRNGLQYDRNELFVVRNDPGFRPTPGQIDNPSNWLHPDAGRLPRTNQWSISVQREITRDFMVEAAYVGNRGSDFTANNSMALNALSEERLASFGLNINNANDRALLRARLDSPAAAARGFNKAPYAGYSLANTVAQSLRPFPQFGNLGISGAPLGESKYDSLQLKGIKRFSHGLSFTTTFTWQNERTNIGTGDNQSVPVNNVFNNPTDQWAVSSLSEPMITVLAFNYEVPAFGSSTIGRALVGGWTFGGILRYASGLPIPVPMAQNQHNTLVFQNTRMNRVPGEPLFLTDLNSGDVDPNKDFALNPKAWVDPAQGEWGTSPAYYDDYRFQRRPEEQLSFGRNFRIGSKTRFEIRAELFNPFNRTFMNNPDASNPLQTQRVDAQGKPIAGFGRIDTGSVFGPQRSGQIVSRISW
jgi:hypothetical protein